MVLVLHFCVISVYTLDLAPGKYQFGAGLCSHFFSLHILLWESILTELCTIWSVFGLTVLCAWVCIYMYMNPHISVLIIRVCSKCKHFCDIIYTWHAFRMCFTGSSYCFSPFSLYRKYDTIFQYFLTLVYMGSKYMFCMMKNGTSLIQTWGWIGPIDRHLEWYSITTLWFCKFQPLKQCEFDGILSI